MSFFVNFKPFQRREILKILTTNYGYEDALEVTFRVWNEKTGSLLIVYVSKTKMFR